MIRLVTNLRILTTVIGFGFFSRADALPDFVRFGYPNCSSCHVSPSGGSILTDYGRSFAAERLSSFTSSNEENFGHGAISAKPDWLLIGGNFRNIQSFIETPDKRRGRWINMQRDVDLCLKNTDSYLCSTGGILSHSSTNPSGKSSYGLRKVFVRHDFNEYLTGRIGRFYPRFGLMIPNHTSPIRTGVGFEAMGETDQAELTYTDEMFEVGIGYEFNDRLRINHSDRIKDQQPALSINFAIAASESTRVGVSTRRVHAASELQAAGVFTSLALGEDIYLMSEIDRIKEGISPALRKFKTTSHHKLGVEYMRGLVQYLQFESETISSSRGRTLTRSYGLGFQYFPRPHFEFDLFGGQLLSDQHGKAVNIAHLLVHYYL
jgi:hypothetical protein